MQIARLFWLFCLPATLQAETLRILNWEEYLSPRVVELWEQETGVAIEEIYFDNDEARDRMLADTNGVVLDIVVIDEVASRLFGDAGHLQPLGDDASLGLDALDGFWRQRCSRYSVPYFWGTLGIAYRTDKVKSPPRSWAELLKPGGRLRGHVGMMDDHMDMLAPALFYLGYPLNTGDRDELKAAFSLLREQAHSVLTYEYAITFLSGDPQANELYMALAYGGDQHALNDITGDDRWAYTIPQEGTLLWVDCLAVMSRSKNVDLARRFIAFLNRPEIAAMNAEDVYFATPNMAAMPLLSEEFRNDDEVYIADELRQRSQLYEILEVDNIKLRQRITSSIIKLHEAD